MVSFIRSFSVQWWAWLVFTGTMIACAVSVKFVGLFIVLLVGFCTITELWDILGDISRPVVRTNTSQSYIISKVY